jgi:hypothetical protein
MRTLLSFTALALVLSLTPASAMCGGGGQQAQASSGQGGMCGRGAAVDDPIADKPAQKPQSMMGMCPCCKNMAGMMGGGMMKGDDPHKGMDMSPKQ